ncbi:amidase [Patulibacter defluvii]|uniref:amidase n=1 Tax=Patulibacter defluvii TaxID=3095358 RepID=UPI002A75A4E0|nr:amidase [Patulibacter sp. DM4]
MTPLHLLSATEALDRFRRRDLSPVELLDAVLARADAVEPTVNALCHRFDDAARARAREAERRYRGRGSAAPGPLEGLPVAVKEDEPIAGQPLTEGSLVLRDAVAERSSALARRVLGAGAIVHARTTAPELAAAGYTHSRLWGVTRNPWSREWSPGGSSGGSGAALAAGTTTLATGSDTAGSIRIPASACGVVGFKPPRGRVPVVAPYHLDRYVHGGPLARTVADAALLQDVLAGPDGDDLAGLREQVVLGIPRPAVRGLRVAFSPRLGDWDVDPEVAAGARAVADVLREAGAIVEEVDLALPRATVIRAAAIHFAHGFGAAIADFCAAHPERVTDDARRFADWARTTADGASLLDGLALESQLHRPLATVLERHHALLCPTLGTRGFRAGEGYPEGGPEVDGRTVGFHLEAALTLPFNQLAACPVLAVPSGVAGNGVPTGVQLVGRPYDDATPFALGAAVEALRPWPLATGSGPRASAT